MRQLQWKACLGSSALALFLQAGPTVPVGADLLKNAAVTARHGTTSVRDADGVVQVTTDGTFAWPGVGVAAARMYPRKWSHGERREAR